jgi:RNA polymerase sigma-70 factor (ECF subfamily)
MTRATELTDEGLLRRMMTGDEEAFTLLYRRRQPALYRFALRTSGNPAVAEDVTQEVFMTLIRDTARFDPTRGTLGGFLFGVARNHLRKRWELDRRCVSLSEDADEFGHTLSSISRQSAGASGNGNGIGPFARPHDEFASLETAHQVRQAIATLPENYREVVVLCELEEMSYEEAAAALNCPVGTVRSRLHRAREILVEKLREHRPLGRSSAVGE